MAPRTHRAERRPFHRQRARILKNSRKSSRVGQNDRRTQHIHHLIRLLHGRPVQPVRPIQFHPVRRHRMRIRIRMVSRLLRLRHHPYHERRPAIHLPILRQKGVTDPQPLFIANRPLYGKAPEILQRDPYSMCAGMESRQPLCERRSAPGQRHRMVAAPAQRLIGQTSSFCSRLLKKLE